VHELVKQTLTTETDPTTLRYAVAALKPIVVEQTEAQSMVARLTDLARHDDPRVRSESLRALAVWDKSGNAAEPSLYQGLLDQTPEVRMTALSIIGETSAHSDRVKSVLMGIIHNTQETTDVKAAALEALQHFSLNRDEYASYNQVSQEVERHLEATTQDGNADEAI
jgi:hypothetical protein